MRLASKGFKRHNDRTIEWSVGRGGVGGVGAGEGGVGCAAGWGGRRGGLGWGNSGYQPGR